MAMDRFLIAPYNTGLQTDLRPFLVPEDAFVKLQNAYLFRGRVRKRFGSIYMGTDAIPQLGSRFRVSVGTTDGAGNIVATPLPAGQNFAIGQMFSIGSAVYTVNVLGAPANLLQTVATALATINTGTQQFQFTGAPATQTIYWYPALPVMGLTTYQQGAIDNQPSFGFDTKFAYQFTNFWDRSFTTSGTVLGPTFHGTDSDFFWSSNYFGLSTNIVTLFTTNFFINNPNGLGIVTDDPIWSYNGVWEPFSYSPDATINLGNTQPYTVTQTRGATAPGNLQIQNYVQQAKIVVPFKNRLVLLNTIENNANGTATPSAITPVNYLTSTNTSFPQRCRFSHNGSPFAKNAWLEPNQVYDPGTGALFADGGGYIDCPTDEQIVSAEFIKDRLIVYFERETWELAYTGNEVLPFVWQKINTELGSESTFSSVPFDKQILTMGTTGVHGCNGANVERIDNKIPDQVFQIRNVNNGRKRVVGIRDYYTELVYWTFPTSDALDAGGTTPVFPNQILVYNYRNNSWALIDDSITTWGYFEQQSGTTWAQSLSPWSAANWSWNSGTTQAQFFQVIAGNQEGYTFIIRADIATNAGVLQITDITNLGSGSSRITAINHNLQIDDFVRIQDASGSILSNGPIYQIVSVFDKDNFDIWTSDTGVYSGGGTLVRVSNINILSKMLNPYLDKDRNVYIAKVDFGVLKTTDGEITVDYYPSSTGLSMIQAGQATGSITGTGVLETSPYTLYPLESQQEFLWHPVYLQTQGQFIQLNLYFSDNQMLNVDVQESDFELEGMTLYCQPTTARLE